MKNFNIPGLQTHHPLNLWFLDMREKHPEFFYPDVKITSVFGAFQFCIWDGGRNFPCYIQAPEEMMLDLKQKYAHFKTPVRFTFTNPVLEKKHLNDRYCNLQLEIFHDENNEVVVNSPLLEDYIRTNYPKYKIISSTTKRLTNPDDLIKELENPNYYQVCLDYDLNKNMELINSIPKELRPKCEFLVNAICPAHCPDRKEHYNDNGRAQLTYLQYKYTKTNCKISKGTAHPTVRGKGNNLSLEDIDKYSKMGYKYFKIEGRTFRSIIAFAEYLYYLIKPEWHGELLITANEAEGVGFNSQNNVNRYQLMDTPYLEQQIGL